MLLFLATALASEPSSERVGEALVEWVTAECGAAQVELHWLGLAEHLLPAEGEPLRFSGTPCGRVPRVELSTPERSVRFQPELEVLVLAPVAVHDAAVGELVTTRVGLVPSSDLREVPLSGTWQASRRIESGEAVTGWNAGPIPALDRGDTVRLLVRRGTLTVVAEGVLVEDAFLGQPVAVVNQVNNRRVEGTLIDAQTVEIH